jgi:acetolactate synthase I/II/III large subunit
VASAEVARSGGHLLADQLVLHGTDVAFCVPGESYLTVLDGLYAHRHRVRLITARHEAGAANMADAYGKLTGRPGVCLVTRGPGAMQAAVGVHTAAQDSTPMILLVGQVARAARGREAFQEIDLRAVFGTLAKDVFEIDDARRIPELLQRAFAVATSGRPGPVVIGIPEDMQRDAVDVADAAPFRPALPAAATAEVERLHALLAAAERPLVVLGGSQWSQSAADALQAFAEASAVPVAASLRRQDHLDNESPAYVGDFGLGIAPQLPEAVAASDLVVLLGTRFGELESGGYRYLGIPRRSAGRLVHVHADAAELGRVYQPDLAIAATAASVVGALAELGPLPASAARTAHATELRAAFERWTTPAPRGLGGVDLALAVARVREVVPPDTIVTNGAGNYTAFVHRYHRHRRYGTQVAPTSGAMGYGLPAAVAAQAVHPGRRVLAFAGDGCFMMASPELATAVQERLPLVVLVADNGMLGTIRMHQERQFPGRVAGTALRNPDFVAMARSFGCHAERVDDTAGFVPAFERALAAGTTALLHLVCDPRAISPTATLEAPGEGEP